MLWVSIFILLGLLMRKFKLSIEVSVFPLLLLLMLSILRMLVAIELPGSVFILSEVFYPAIISFARFEITPRQILGVPINPLNLFICVWALGTVIFMALRIVMRYLISRFVDRVVLQLPHYEYGESMLKGIIGADKKVDVFKTSEMPTPFTIGFKSCIILPDIDFPPDELRVILLHEWKHCQNKDNFTRFVVGMFWAVFWWNPLFYILRRNICFIQEVKCDYFAVSTREDYVHLKSAISRLEDALLARPQGSFSPYFISLVNSDDEIRERLDLLAARVSQNGSTVKSKLINVLLCVAIVVMFVVSYGFTVLPFTNVDSVIETPAENFVEDYYYEDGGVFNPVDNFIVDNGDGTFSLYIDGRFVMNSTNISEDFRFFSRRQRGEI